MNIIIASNRPFPNRTVKSPEELDLILNKINWVPEYILFPFWSWKVPKEITDKYDCIGFHTGHFAGGSPIQNLIRNGVNSTLLKAFKMNDEIDGGEAIWTTQVSLLGSLEEIMIRITEEIDGYIQENYGQFN